MGNPIRATGGELLTDASALQIREIEKKITRLSASTKQLSTLTMLASIEVKNQYKFDIQTMPARPHYVTIMAIGADANAGKIQVSDADVGWVSVGMNLRLNADTAPRVTAVTSYAAEATYQLTLSSTAGLTVGDKLYLGASSYAENSAAPTPITRVPDVVTQYIGTIRCAHGLSWMAASSANYSGVREFQTEKECQDYLKAQLEASCWFDKKEEIAGPPYQLKPGGFFYVATAAGNVIALEDNVFTLGGMRQVVRLAGRYMPSKRLHWFVSPKGAEFIDRIQLAKAVPSRVVDIPELGMSLPAYKFGQKELLIHEVDQLADGALENEMGLLDPAGLAAATTKNQKTGKRNWMIQQTNAETPGTAGNIGVFTCDFAPNFIPSFCWRVTGAASYRNE